MVAKLVLACSVFCLCSTALAQTGDEHAKRFSHLPDVSRPRLSPDGRYLALQIPRDGVPAILVIDLSGKTEQQSVLGTTQGGFKIGDCQWAKNDRLLCILDYTALNGSQPYYEYAMYSLAPDGNGSKEILIDEPWLRLVNRLADDPNNIAIEKLSSLISDERYDITGFDALPSLSNRAARVSVLTEVLEHRWLDTGMTNSQRQLNALIPGATAIVERASQDMQRSVVRFEADRIAPYYVLFDAAAQPRVLGKAYPDLDGNGLAPTRVVRVRMRGYIQRCWPLASRISRRCDQSRIARCQTCGRA